MELAQDRVQWLALVLAELNFRVLFSREFVKTYLGEAGCKGGTCVELAQDYNQW